MALGLEVVELLDLLLKDLEDVADVEFGEQIVAGDPAHAVDAAAGGGGVGCYTPCCDPPRMLRVLDSGAREQGRAGTDVRSRNQGVMAPVQQSAARW